MANNLLTGITTWLVDKELTDPLVAGVQLRRVATGEIDVPASRAIIASLLGTTVVDPVAAGTTYTGVWVISDITLDVDERNHGKIYQLLTKVTPIVTFVNLPTPLVKTQTDEILELFGLQPGGEIGIVHQYLYLNPDDIAAIELAPAYLPAATATILIGATPTVVTCTGAKHVTNIEEKGDRTATLSVLWSYTRWPNTTPAPVITSENVTDSTIVETYFGVPLADAAGHVQTLKATDGAELTGFVDNGKGGSTITRRRVVHTPLSEDGYLVIDMKFSATLGTSIPIGILLRWKSLSKTDADTLIATLISDGDITFVNLYGLSGTFHIVGITPANSGADVSVTVELQNIIWTGGIGVGSEIVGFAAKTRFSADGAKAYLWSHDRQMFASDTLAKAYANSGDPIPIGIHDGQAATKISGSYDYNDQLGVWVAYKEHWTEIP